MTNDQLRLKEILFRIEKALRFTAQGEAHFYGDDLVQEATIRQVEIIGEAANAISRETRDRDPQIPWRELIRVRNRAIHHYWDVDLHHIWAIVEQDLPDLEIRFRRLLDLPPHQAPW